MNFGEALTIVYTLALAQRPLAENHTSKELTEKDIDEAFDLVEERVAIAIKAGHQAKKLKEM